MPLRAGYCASDVSRENQKNRRMVDLKNLIIKITDEDWDRRTGGICGGGVARKLLSPKDTQGDK